ncbi:MAG: vitamin K epoxide reductase family protein [Candidatus Saccharibacteria bacterium]|nr:vitamin K epoxide reductase family protein [Candidatus Saccharibacteria bacterium]
MPRTKNRAWSIQRSLPFILLIGGAIGLLASFVLTIETINLLKDPSYQPSCSINPLFDCGSAMTKGRASSLGLPDPVVGIAAFSVVITVGVAMLAGARLKRWFWQAFNLGALGGVIFMHWMFFQSLYVLGTLCPFCMVVWGVTIPIFWYVTLYSLREGNLVVPKSLIGLKNFVLLYHKEILVSWFVLLAALVLHEFWYYWQTLLP